MADNAFRDLHIKQIAEAQAMLNQIPPDPPPPPAPPPPSPPPPPTGLIPDGTLLAQQYGSFTLTVAQRVRYGADTRWYARDFQPGTYTATDPTPFADAAFNVSKSAVSMGAATGAAPGTVTIAAPPPPAPPPPPPTGLIPDGTVLAQQYGSFTLTVAQRVRYGADTRWYARDFQPGTYTATDPTPFADAAFNVSKSAVSMGAATGAAPGSVTIAAPPPPAPPPGPPQPPAPDSIVTAGVIDPVKYKAMAEAWHTDAAMTYRFGAPAPTTPAGTAYYERQRIPFQNNTRTYLAGIGTGWQDDPGDFSSNIGHAPFVADEPDARVGAAGFETENITNNTFSCTPALTWTRGGEGIDAYEVVHPWRDQGRPTRKVMCYAGNHGRPGWSCNTLFAFAPDASGRSFVANAGANTMGNRLGFWLPAGLTPTCVAVTNSGEFALFACWDTARTRAVLVVVVLTTLGDGGTRANPDTSGGTQEGAAWGEPRIEMPGIPGISNWMAAKILGQIDLPTNMRAPTDISITTSVHRYDYLSAGPANSESWMDYTYQGFNAAERAVFRDGGNHQQATARKGTCIIVSRTEKTACFVNLTPLVQYYRTMYFSASESVYNETRNLGDAANQWPYTFAHAPQQTPTILTTINVPQVPVSVHSSPWGPEEAYIGTESGHLLKYALAGTLLATYNIGANITGIRTYKEKAFGSLLPWGDLTTLLVTCRGERAIKFVNSENGAILKTVQPTVAQLRDPIVAEDNDNHGDTNHSCTVADYTGKRVSAFLYGPVRLRPWSNWAGGTWGPGPNGNDVAEYCGALNLPGKAWGVRSANIS